MPDAGVGKADQYCLDTVATLFDWFPCQPDCAIRENMKQARDLGPPRIAQSMVEVIGKNYESAPTLIILVFFGTRRLVQFEIEQFRENSVEIMR